jgi:hypothetical protein
LRAEQAAAQPQIDRTPWRAWVKQYASHFHLQSKSRHEALWDWFARLEDGVSPPARIEDWPRGGGKSSSVEYGATYAGTTGRRTFGLYVSGTQAKADVHVQSIAGILERMGIARAVNKYNHSKGWTQQRLRAANGFNVVSFGLDAGSRGVKLDDYRPDLIIFDDVDERHDSLAAAQKKIETMTESILPAGSTDVAVLFVQNTIHADSVMAQLIDGRAKFLLDRDPIIVEKAVRDLTYEERREGDSLRYVITDGDPTWDGQSLAVCEQQINLWGLTAFLRESQHEVDNVTGSMFSHLDFEPIRVDHKDVPRLQRVAVWCDPAVTNTDQSDCNGIQVDGMGVDNLIYRLFSWEQRATPVQTIKKAYEKAIEYGALTIGIETDQGGDTWYSVVEQAWQDLKREGRVPEGTRQPRFVGARAGSIGPKAERGSRMLTAYERHKIRHVRGTHTVLEKALNRFLIKKPFDLVDAAFWSWDDLANGGSPGI